MKNQYDLKTEYRKLSGKFHTLSLREQCLILLCGLVILILLMYTFVFQPLIVNSNKLQQNNVSTKRELASLSVQVAQLTEKLNTDPNDPVNERIAVLKNEIQSMTTQLETQTHNLVPANKMAGMLESVLAGSKGLKLIELQSIAPIPIMLGTVEEDEEPKAGLYRHGVTLIFEGQYFDIQQYLEELESLPWKFYWKKFDYLVGDYPTASVELEIYTLSTNKAFIGV
ncbi:type II secretion system protein GspM [uncultured Paraglaciecola sp.]|uniref:type II secretion system protein GspM n=1 Tax=uncultured Paraglaciecola sp. TaxID=1765024 RepID=UPI0030DB14F9